MIPSLPYTLLMLEATGGWRWFYGLIEDGKASTDAAEVEGEVIDSIREAGIGENLALGDIVMEAHPSQHLEFAKPSL